MKKVIFRTHPILLIEGRLFTLISLFFPLLMLCVSLYFFFREKTPGPFLGAIMSIGFFSLALWLMNFFWPLCWGKLILSQNEIIWKCLFYKKVKILYSDIRILVIRSFHEGNVVRIDVYRTGFEYLLISTAGLPKKRIDKIQCCNGLIKWKCSKKVCEALIERVPKQFCGELKRYLK